MIKPFLKKVFDLKDFDLCILIKLKDNMNDDLSKKRTW